MRNPAPCFADFVDEGFQRVFRFVGRVEPPLHPSSRFSGTCNPLEQGHADQHSGRLDGLLDPPKEGRPFRQVLENIREDDHVEPAILAAAKAILHAVFHARMSIPVARRLDVLGAEVHAHDPGADRSARS